MTTNYKQMIDQLRRAWHDAIALMIRQGHKMGEIETVLGASRSTIQKVMEDYGLEGTYKLGRPRKSQEGK